MTVEINAVLNAFIFAILGIVIFGVAFLIIDKMTPYDLWKEVVENKNTALATLLAAWSLGVCIIIAAAVH